MPGPAGTQPIGMLIGVLPMPHVVFTSLPADVHTNRLRTLHTNEPKIAAVPTNPASGLPMRLPRNTRIVNDASGRTVARISSSAGAGRDIISGQSVSGQWSGPIIP